ncbi:MAG: hypothetical protein C0418_00195 [Coriobacteriaceae bacterium]|nr:hypothetical protein [Coriobacteriaceae bacterium]
MSGRVLSRYTVLMVALMLGSVAVAAGLNYFPVLGDTVALWAADLGSVAVVGLAAAIVVGTAYCFGKGQPGRLYWMLVGVGAAMYALGDLVWSIYELAGNEVPYPGLPDAFYLAEYVFLTAGLAYAAWSYRSLGDIKMPLALSGAVGAAAAGGLYVWFLNPLVLSDPEIAAGEKALGVAYPAFDVFLAFMPAVLIILMVSRLGWGRFGWPWWAVAVGVLFIAASDTAYAWLAAVDRYESGMILDYGWMLGHVAIATGALLARDVTRVPRA